ncbi:MAG: thioredoxin [Planctomycetota bacterium]|jgi:thioredoxin 1|nr:thioredoxin [Planctomycetota bacterium]MDP6940931.1 thioredoxin [Planctomycetota bacterium]
MSNAQDVTEADFQTEVLDSEKPVLVDFWAPWCGPCKAMGPAVDKLAEEMGEKVKVVKLDIDQSPGVASQLGVMSIPTFIVFKNGTEAARKMGMMSFDDFKSLVEDNA